MNCYNINFGTFAGINKFDTFIDEFRPVARGGQGGQLTPPLRTKGLLFWNLAREIIKANNYKWLTIYLHQLLCTKPPTKWLQNLLSKGGSGGANL